MNDTFRTVLGCIVAFAIASVPLAAQTVPYGAATPQELIQRMEKAAKTDDLAEMVRCMEPEGRQAMAAMITLMPIMMMAFGGMAGAMADGVSEAATGESQDAAAKVEQEMAALKQDFTALLAKYNIGDPFDEEADFDAETALADIDQGAYVADVLAFLNERFPGESGSKKPMPFEAEDFAITELTVTGDYAVAKAGDESAEMIRIDGRWYLHTPEDRQIEP